MPNSWKGIKAISRQSLGIITPFLLFLLLVGALPVAGTAQYFGKNKVQYEDHGFRTYRDQHFRIHHYLPDSVVKRMSDWSQNWYFRHSKILKEELPSGNPMILYADHPDFQQTHAINSLIGVGTGGVTEGGRKRVVMPLSASHAETDHVLGHELVHAFQYTMVERGDSTNMNSLRNVPLWMVEGLAEYLSIGGKDPMTSMWLRDDLYEERLPSIRKMTRRPDQYFPYRYGHAFWAFISGKYGMKAIRPLFMNSAIHGHRRGIKMTLGISADSLSSLWKNSIENQYQGVLDSNELREPGRTIVGADKNDGESNLTPALSPKGDLMAFISDRRVLSMEYFIADGKTGSVMDRVEKGIRSSHIDDLNFFSSAPAWSPQGKRLAIVTHAKGDHQLLVYDVQRQEASIHQKIPNLPAFQDPAWSPDGHRIVLSGLKDGKSDIFIYELKTEKLKRVTDDPYSNIQPDWSPDGKSLLFASDRGPGTDVAKGRFNGYSICRYDLENEKLHRYSFFEGAENLEPQYGPEGSSFFFLSDRSGKRDLYSYDLTNDKLGQRTDFRTGIYGLTQTTPAYDIASESGAILMNHYVQGEHRIRRSSIDELPKMEVKPKTTDQELAWLPPGNVLTKKGEVERLLERNSSSEEGEDEPYDPDFGLKYGGNVSIGAGIDQMGTAMMGGVSLLFSDDLKRDQLYTNLRVNGNVEDLGGIVSYLNRRNRIGWNINFSHIPYRSYWSRYDIVSFQGRRIGRQVIELTRIFEDRVGMAAHYPISKNLRWELGGNVSRYGFRQDSIVRYYDGRYLLQEEQYRGQPQDPFFTYDGYIAFVGDESSFGLTSPLEGYRFRYELGANGGRFRYNSVLIDQRKYWFFGDFGVALRGIHQARYGSGASGLYPLYIGYDQFLRGYAGAGYAMRGNPTGDYLDQGRLIGTRTAIANAEVRVPLLGPEQLSLISSRTFYGDLVGFVDGAMAWNGGSEVGMNWDPQPGVRSPLVSTGIGFRLNLYGMIVLEPYWAIPFQDSQNRSGRFGFYLSSSGW